MAEVNQFRDVFPDTLGRPRPDRGSRRCRILLAFAGFPGPTDPQSRTLPRCLDGQSRPFDDPALTA